MGLPRDPGKEERQAEIEGQHHPQRPVGHAQLALDHQQHTEQPEDGPGRTEHPLPPVGQDGAITTR